MRFSQASLATAVVLAAGTAASASIVHFSNGNQIWTSLDSGATFALSDSAASFQTAGGSALAGQGIVGLGQRGDTGQFYATAADGWLYTVTGLGSSNVLATRLVNLSSSTISFDFFDNGAGATVFRGVRGNDLIEVNLTTLAISVINANTGLSSVPATARIGSQYFGLTSNGNFYRINNAGAATQIGANNVTGLNGVDSAGGSAIANAYNRFFVTAGFDTAGNNDMVRFGWIDHTSGAFNLLSSTNVGALAGQMGMVTVVPFPAAALAGGATLLGLAVARRRILRR